jgi:hypothetical protein
VVEMNSLLLPGDMHPGRQPRHVEAAVAEACRPRFLDVPMGFVGDLYYSRIVCIGQGRQVNEMRWVSNGWGKRVSDRIRMRMETIPCCLSAFGINEEKRGVVVPQGCSA